MTNDDRILAIEKDIASMKESVDLIREVAFRASGFPCAESARAWVETDKAMNEYSSRLDMFGRPWHQAPEEEVFIWRGKGKNND